MSRWQNNALQVIFKVVILAAAGVVAITIRATFHFQSDHLTGITFFVSAIGLYLVFQRVFPSVYGRSGLPANRPGRKRCFILEVKSLLMCVMSQPRSDGTRKNLALAILPQLWKSTKAAWYWDIRLMIQSFISQKSPTTVPAAGREGRRSCLPASCERRTTFCLRAAWRSARFKTTLAVINCFTSEIWKGTNWKCVSNLKVMQRPSRKLAC
jgi:hypothetical protein